MPTSIDIEDKEVVPVRLCIALCALLLSASVNAGLEGNQEGLPNLELSVDKQNARPGEVITLHITARGRAPLSWIMEQYPYQSSSTAQSFITVFQDDIAIARHALTSPQYTSTGYYYYYAPCPIGYSCADVNPKTRVYVVRDPQYSVAVKLPDGRGSTRLRAVYNENVKAGERSTEISVNHAATDITPALMLLLN